MRYPSIVFPAAQGDFLLLRKMICPYVFMSLEGWGVVVEDEILPAHIVVVGLEK